MAFCFMDDLMHAGRRQWFNGFMGGVIFNLANMLLVAAISLAGMAVAFPIGIGMALVIGVVWNYLIKPVGNPQLLFFGCAIIVAAIVVDAMAYRALSALKFEQLAKAGKVKSTRKRVSIKGVILSIVSGLLMGSFFPWSHGPRLRPGRYGGRPRHGSVCHRCRLRTRNPDLYARLQPVLHEPARARRAGGNSRLLSRHFQRASAGLAGWNYLDDRRMANFVASSAPPEVQVGPATSYALGEGATMVSALWGAGMEGIRGR